MDIYPKYPHSCILYLASILVDEYGAIDVTRPGLLHMLQVFPFSYYRRQGLFQTLATATFTLLMGTGTAVEIAMRDNPDTVDDLFRLAAR